MLFWILIAFLTAAAILAVLLPLGRMPRANNPAEHARQVYLDQLAELEGDQADGRINASEAEAARAEVGRRLIAVDSEAQTPAAAHGSRFARIAVSLVALVGIPIVSLSLYLGLGAPGLPGAPLAARVQQPTEAGNVEALIAKVERHLAEQPEDGQGWEVVGPVYLSLGRGEDAARAFQNAIRLLGSTAARQAKLGEALWMAAGGIVTAEARAAFEAANALDPAAPEPRFFLAVAAQQEGDFDEAAAILTALLADAPADAPWRSMVEHALAQLNGGAAPPSASPPAAPGSGPSAADVAAAEQMAPDDRAAMVEGMVERLATRLEANPDDAQGWQRLIRSYMVLGKTDEAAEAARAALAGVSDAGARQQVEALIAEMNVPVEMPEPAADAPGPTAADVAAAEEMAPADRSAMIEGMVGRLATRLEANPDDADGWLMLIRSYVVLGKSDAAAKAARDALAGVTDSGERERVEALIADLGVTPAGATTQ